VLTLFIPPSAEELLFLRTLEVHFRRISICTSEKKLVRKSTVTHTEK
jgi:hypothetical protein